MQRVLVSWSSGKDSAWMLHQLRQRSDIELVGLLTTFNESNARVAMHGVRRELVEQQARAVGLPLWAVPLPWPCSNDIYETRMSQHFEHARRAGVTQVAFGDLFLEEIRDYRVRQLEGSGLEPIFPIWCGPEGTDSLADEMIQQGFSAILTCVDSKQLEPGFVGRRFDAGLLAAFPPGVDRCGERGEFHTFCDQGPIYPAPLAVSLGETVQREEFVFSDLLPTEVELQPTVQK